MMFVVLEWQIFIGEGDFVGDLLFVEGDIIFLFCIGVIFLEYS